MAPLCPVNFLVFQMSQEKEVLELEDMLLLEDSDSEMFQTADEACLSEEERERPAGAEAPGQRRERPAGAEATGSKQETEEEQGQRSIWGGETGAPSSARRVMRRRPVRLVERVRFPGPPNHCSSRGPWRSRRGTGVTRNFGDNRELLRSGVPYGAMWPVGQQSKGTLPAGPHPQGLPGSVTEGGILGGSGRLHCRRC